MLSFRVRRIRREEGKGEEEEKGKKEGKRGELKQNKNIRILGTKCFWIQNFSFIFIYLFTFLKCESTEPPGVGLSFG